MARSGWRRRDWRVRGQPAREPELPDGLQGHAPAPGKWPPRVQVSLSIDGAGARGGIHTDIQLGVVLRSSRAIRFSQSSPFPSPQGWTSALVVAPFGSGRLCERRPGAPHRCPRHLPDHQGGQRRNIAWCPPPGDAASLTLEPAGLADLWRRGVRDDRLVLLLQPAQGPKACGGNLQLVPVLAPVDQGVALPE